MNVKGSDEWAFCTPPVSIHTCAWCLICNVCKCECVKFPFIAHIVVVCSINYVAGEINEQQEKARTKNKDKKKNKGWFVMVRNGFER